jgi:hypothetical protein
MPPSAITAACGGLVSPWQLISTISDPDLRAIFVTMASQAAARAFGMATSLIPTRRSNVVTVNPRKWPLRAKLHLE